MSTSIINDTALRQSVVVMVEPTRFYCNEATCADNYFQQQEVGEKSSSDTRPLEEHRKVYEALKERNIAVKLYRLAEEDGLGEPVKTDSDIPLSAEEQKAILATKPDAIFPNNSISFHELPAKVGTTILERAGVNIANRNDACLYTAAVLYPMCPGRRNEIPKSLLCRLKAKAHILVRPQFVGGIVTEPASWSFTAAATSAFSQTDFQNYSSVLLLIDFRGFEDLPKLVAGYSSSSMSEASWALEGTGSLNFSADGMSVYATASQRCHFVPFHLLCDVLGIPNDEGHRFLIPNAVDTEGRCIYHTNVVGWVGDFGLCAWTRDALRFDTLSSNATTPTSAFVRKEAFEASLALQYPHAITLSLEHLMQFAGNAMYLRSRDGVSYVAMSLTAATAMAKGGLLEILNAQLVKVSTNKATGAPMTGFEQFSNIIICSIPTIERLGGGSVRCLLAASLSATEKGFEALENLIQ